MWFKKKSVLQSEGNYNSNYNAVDYSDWRPAILKDQTWSVSQTPPSAADAGKYFFLPALGQYYAGQLYGVGTIGFYWSSSARAWEGDGAYGLTFRSGQVEVMSDYARGGAFRVDGFE